MVSRSSYLELDVRRLAGRTWEPLSSKLFPAVECAPMGVAAHFATSAPAVQLTYLRIPEAARALGSAGGRPRPQGSSHRWHVQIRLAEPSGVDRQLAPWLSAADQFASGDREREK